MSCIPLVLKLFEDRVPTFAGFVISASTIRFTSENEDEDDLALLKLIGSYCYVYHSFKNGDFSVVEQEDYKNIVDENGVVNPLLPAELDTDAILTMYQNHRTFIDTPKPTE